MKDPGGPVQPIQTLALFPDLLIGLLELAHSITEDGWATPVPRKRWTVKDVALHLLGGDVGILSRARDGYSPSTASTSDHTELVTFLAHVNDSWIQATQRISPRLLYELLSFTGNQVNDYFRSLDLHALGERVSWAGPDAAPNWLGIAREYTERWHHQQHMREAIGRPGFTEPRFLRPALDTFVRALPHTYRNVTAPDGTAIELTVSGDSGGTWWLSRERARWRLSVGRARDANARVAIPQEIAWRLWTKWLPKEEALRSATIGGDDRLAAYVFEMTAVIA